MTTAVTSYSVVKALHVIAVLVSYGLPLAYPIMLPYLRRRHARAMPAVHEVQLRLNIILTGPGTLLVLSFGVYLASKDHLWHQTYVQVGLGAIVAIGAIGGWVLSAAKRMAALSAADVEAAPPGAPVVWSPAYEALYRRYTRVELVLAAIVLVTVFFMTAKPGG